MVTEIKKGFFPILEEYFAIFHHIYFKLIIKYSREYT